ncbi:MAG: DUF3107 domain-containing protein [Acidimicrobiia bacterium]
MEVRIGVVHTPKELTLESDADPESVLKTIEDAVTAGSAFIWLEDGKGRKLGVPADKIAYVEFKTDEASNKVGFGR